MNWQTRGALSRWSSFAVGVLTAGLGLCGCEGSPPWRSPPELGRSKPGAGELAGNAQPVQKSPRQLQEPEPAPNPGAQLQATNPSECAPRVSCDERGWMFSGKWDRLSDQVFWDPPGRQMPPNSAKSRTGMPVMAKPPEQKPSELALSMRRSDGTEAQRVSVHTDRPHDGGRTTAAADTVRFSAQAEYDPAVQHVVLLRPRTGEELSTHTASPHAPSLCLRSPRAGQTIGDELAIAWSATDADGDIVRASLEYRGSHTQNYRALASAVTGSKYNGSVAALPGGATATVRIQLSDGFHSACVLSETFAVPTKPPRVTLRHPSASGRHRATHHVHLKAFAHDSEDGQLQDSRLQWSSDVDGDLGSGTHSVLLSQGVHRLTVTARDSDGMLGTDSVVVSVE